MPNARRRDSRTWIPLLTLAAGLALLYLLWKVLLVFILAALFAFIVHPVVRLFDRKMPHAFSIITVYLLIAILLIIVVGLLAPVVSQQFRELVDAIPAYVERARELFDEIQQRYVALPSGWRTVADRALTELQATAVRLTQQTVPAAFGFLSGLFALVFVPLLAFFMLLDEKGYKRMVIAVTPRRHRRTANDLLTCTGQVLRSFIKGQLMLMSIVGTAVGAGLYLVGMPYAAVFAVLAGLLELIPTFGPILTTVVVTLVALVIDPVLALKAASVTILVQLLENVFLVPLVMARAVGLNPVTVAFAVFLGGSAAGIPGAIIAIPLAMMVKVVILYFYVEDRDLPGRQAIAQCLPRRKPRVTRRGRGG